ncbi:amino acid transporter [Meredithblackwellia eburnea MCA 4105]
MDLVTETKMKQEASAAPIHHVHSVHQQSGDVPHALVVERAPNQHLKQEFSTFSLIGLGFVICNSWLGVGLTMVIGLAQGGPVLLLYGLLLIVLVFVCVAFSLSELASVYPTAGGQYHWSCFLAPPRHKRVASFLNGFVNIAAWQTFVASILMIFAQVTIGIATIKNPSLEIKPWHYFVLYQVGNIICTLFNWYGIHKAPFLYQFGLFFTLGLFIMTFFSLLCGPGAIHSHASSNFVWKTFANEVGWSSNGVVFITGLVNVNYAYSGFDGAIHLAEDLKNPSRDVPKALFATVIIGLLTGFPWLIASLYSVQDFADAAASPTGVPMISIFLQTIQNEGAVIFIMTLLLLSVLLAALGSVQSAGRLTWSFAADGALIGSKYLAWLDTRVNCAPYSLFFNFFWVFLIGCLFLASSTVFNSIVGCCLILQHISYAIPVSLLMARGRRLPRKPWMQLGSFAGWLVNFVTVAWAVLITIFYSFPVIMPVTSSNMNYCSAVLAIIVLLAGLNWIVTRKTFSTASIEALMPAEDQGVDEEK